MAQVLILMLYSLAGLTGLGFVAGIMVWAFDGTVNVGAMAAMALLTAMWIWAGVVVQRLHERSRQPRAIGVRDKAKRGATDMYAMIDRLVYELTPDERDYLQRRLDETVRDDDGEDDLGTTLESLLSEREARHLAD